MAFWPSRIDFRVAEGAAEDLTHLIQYADRLPEIIDLASKQDYASGASEVIGKVAAASHIDYSTVYSIFNSLENYRAIAEEIGSPERSFRQITRAIDPDTRQKLEGVRDQIIHAIELYDLNNPVSIAFKAQKLTYLREKLFHEAEIITDARPVFDAKGERILEMVITHSLVITYWARTGWETIHLTLDAADVLSIRKATDRAVIKAQALKTALAKQWKTEVVRDET